MEREEIIQAIQEDLLKTMLTNTDLRATDRNPLAGNGLLAFDGFKEFYDDFKKWPLARFSHVDKLFASLIEIYFVSQLKPFIAAHEGEDDETWRQVIKDATKAKEEEFVQILTDKYPHLCAEIEKKRNASPIF
jgi:hypothetical protein